MLGSGSAGVVIIAALGCDARIPPDARISTTRSSNADDGQRRAWAISRDGILQSLLTAADASATWRVEPGQGLVALPGGGVSTLSWVREEGAEERAYLVNLAGQLRARALGPSGDRWLDGTTPEPVRLLGPTAAVHLFGSLIVVGAPAALSNGDRTLVAYVAGSPNEGGYVGQLAGSTPPAGLAGLTRIASAQTEETWCFFLQTNGGQIAATALGSTWHVPPLPGSRTVVGGVAGAGRSVAGTDELDAFVVTNDARVYRARWNGSCDADDFAGWEELPSVPGGVATTVVNGLGATSQTVAGEVQISVAAAGADGAMYLSTSKGATGWVAWAQRSAPGDVTGVLGGVHVVAAPSGGPPLPHVLYVGRGAPAVGYLFEQRSPNPVSARNYLDRTIDFTVLSPRPAGATFEDFGVWTESALAERDGRMMVTAVATDSDATSPTRRHWVWSALSNDDGHTWSDYASAPSCYLQPGEECLADAGVPQTFEVLQGDPQSAIDSLGRRWMAFHEFPVLHHTTVLDALYSSALHVFRRSRGSTVEDLRLVRDLDDDISNPHSPLSECHFLDHPWLVAVGDTLELVWQEFPIGQCEGNRETRFFHASRASDGTWSAPVMLHAQATGSSVSPVAAVAGGSRVWAAWLTGDPNRDLAYNSHIDICVDPSEGCDDVVDATEAFGHCVSTSNQNAGPISVRSALYALAGHPTDPARFYLAYMRRGGLACEQPIDGPPEIWMVQGTETASGITWSEPQRAMSGFNPDLAVQGDGTVFITGLGTPATTTVSPWLAVCPACSPTAPAFELAIAPGAAPVDLTRLPHKIGDDVEGSTRFIGDYHVTTGGVTRVHLMRTDTYASPEPLDRPARALTVSTVSRWLRP